MGRTASNATSRPTSRPKSKAAASCREPIVRLLRRAKTTRAKTAQGEQLPLPLKGSWGGARRGAGRKPTGRAGVPHRARPEHNWRHPVHVSLKVDPRLPNLRTPLCIRTIEACFRALQLAKAKQQGKQAQMAEHQHGSGGTTGKSSKSSKSSEGSESSMSSRIGFRLVHYSVQPHHLHLIIEAQDRETLERGLRGLAIRLARQLNKALGRRGRVFVDRYFARALKTPRETRNCLRYVLLNTAKHESQRRAQRREWRSQAGQAGQGQARARAEVPERGRDWLDPCSSGVYFEGWKEGSFREGWLEELVRRRTRGKAERMAAERMAAERARLVLPVTEARTWLLQRGWRQRWGLISLNEVPGPAVRAAHEVHATRTMAER